MSEPKDIRPFKVKACIPTPQALEEFLQGTGRNSRR